MRIRRKKAPAGPMAPGWAWFMAATAMVHFSICAPEPVRAKESSNEDGAKKRKPGLPNQSGEWPDEFGFPDERWRSAAPPANRLQPLGRHRLLAQANDKEFDFDIPPQPLASALNRFGEQTGTQFAYTTEDVENVQSGGVTGHHTSKDALRLLLTDTELDYRVTGPNTVTLKKKTSSDDGVAAPLVGAAAVGAGAGAVMAADATSGEVATEEGTQKPVKVPEVVVRDVKERMPVVDSPDGYKADVSSEAVLRFPTPIQELPQSVGVVTKDSIRERRAVTQQQALEGIAGVGKTSQSALAADDYFIRGFATDQRTPGFTRDNGLSAFNSYFSDPTLYERIEVIKGPASFTSGLVGAGGFVNRLLKAPQKENFVITEAGAGSAGHYRTTLDANGVLPTLPIAGRFVFAQNQDPEFFRNSGNQRFSFLPSVRFSPSDDFDITIIGNVQRLRGKGYIGTSTNTEGGIPASLFDSLLASDNTFSNDYQSAHIEAEKRFVQGFRLKAKGQYSHSDSNYRYGASYQPGGIGASGNFDVYGFGRDLKRDSLAGEISLTKDFSLLGNLSSVAFGMDYSSARQRSLSTDFLFLGTGNLSNPNNNIPFPPALSGPATNVDQDLTIQQTGLFAQGLLRPLAGTTVMLALRGNWINQQGEANFASNAEVGMNQSKLTPQLGISQRVIEGLNVYASYGESIQANFAITSNGSLLAPMTGKSFEIGSKWEPLAQRIRVTAALFRTNLDNVSTPDPNNLLFSIGGQGQRNQGFEFEAQGALIPRLQVNLAYTFLEAEITKSPTPGVVGTRAYNVPKHTVSAFGSYDFSELLTTGLKLGAVVYYRSEVSGTPGVNQDETFAGYSRADVFAIYAPLKWLSLQLNVNNVFNTHYIEAPVSYSAFNQFGAPRHVIGMLRLTF